MNTMIIDNVPFDTNNGIRISKMKAKGGDCPEFLKATFGDMWQDVKPLSFLEVCQLENVEQRRIAFRQMDPDVFMQYAKHLRSATIAKKTTWVKDDGTLEEATFEDTYELYAVSARALNMSSAGTYYLLRMKDTSTDRYYHIWVDLRDAYGVNGYHQDNTGILLIEEVERDYPSVSPIDAVAWTIRTTVPEGSIDYIIRQGDCILVKPVDGWHKGHYRQTMRALTGTEYRTLLRYES